MAANTGALTTDAGDLDISWRSDGDVFTIDWTERDSPPVRPLKRRGFGSIVIESMASVGGEVHFEWSLGYSVVVDPSSGNAFESGRRPMRLVESTRRTPPFVGGVRYFR
jgi:hypothetical protein